MRRRSPLNKGLDRSVVVSPINPRVADFANTTLFAALMPGVSLDVLTTR